MSEKICYVVCIVSSKIKYFLLWKDGGNNQTDVYILDPDNRLLLSKTSAGILEKAAMLGLTVSSQEPDIVDMDKMWEIISKIYPSRTISRESCKIILDNWNAIEDIIKSLNLTLSGFPKLHLRIIQDAYEKIFVGCDVLDILPAKQKNRTVLSVNEIKYTKRFLRLIWRKALTAIQE